jgi:Family of unknown function (DUF5719)
VSDQQPPAGGPDEDRPAPLIPSRAARHQAKRGLLRRRPGAPARPAAEPSGRPRPEDTGPADRSGRQRPQAPTGPAAERSGWPRPEPSDRQRREPSGRQRPEPFGRQRPEPRVRPVPGPSAKAPSEARPREDPRRRRAFKSPQLRPPRPADLRGSSLGLAGTLVVVAAVLVLAANALPSAKPPATPAAADPYSARWVCPLLPGQTTRVTIANVGNATASLRTTVRETGTKSDPATKDLAGGATQKLSLKPEKAGFVQVEAFSAPVVVSAPGLGCAPGPGNRWWLPASDTRFGSDTRVIIANPDNQPAVVDLVPHLTSGSIRPDDREVFIQPGEAVVRALGDEAPAGLKPSIEVVARAGRVVAGAAVSTGGREPTLLPAQGTAQPAWSFAGGVSGGGRQAEVLVTNPNPDPLQVDVQVITAKATFRPPGEFGEPIANGGTAELGIPALDVQGPFAVHVRSVNGAPFVAALRVTEGDGNETSSRIDVGTGQPERDWLVPGTPEGGELVLANLSSTELEARLGDLTDRGGGGAGQPVRVPAGRVALKKVPDGIDNLVVQAGSAGLVAAPLNGGPIVPGSAIGGLPAGGPITPGPAAAP